MKKINLFVLITTLLSGFMVGCSKDSANNGSILLSDISCSFSCEGGSTTVVVGSNADWSVAAQSDWFSVEKISDKEFIVTAQENYYGIDREGYILVMSGSNSLNFTVYQLGDNSREVIYREANSYFYSKSKRYCGGLGRTADAGVFRVVVHDVETEETFFYGPFSTSVYSGSNLSVRAVIDDGDMYLSTGKGWGNSELFYFNRRNGTITPFDSGEIYGCSADGTVAVGCKYEYAGENQFAMSYPCKWVNGVPKILPMPETTYRGYDWEAGILLRCVSSDGKVCVGTEWLNTDHFCIWWDENDEWHYVGDDVRRTEDVLVQDAQGNVGYYTLVTGIYNENAIYMMSNNGEWITGTYINDRVSEEDGRITVDYFPAFYNTKEHKTYIFSDYPESAAIAVTSDGIGFIRTGVKPAEVLEHNLTDYYTVDIRSLTTISDTQTWYHDTYGIYPPAQLLTLAISDDYRTAVFYNSYIHKRSY